MFLPGCCSTSAPVILEQPSDTVVARGEPVTLNCKVRQLYHQQQTHWARAVFDVDELEYFVSRFRDLDWIPLLFLSQEKFSQLKVFMTL